MRSIQAIMFLLPLAMLLPGCSSAVPWGDKWQYHPLTIEIKHTGIPPISRRGQFDGIDDRVHIDHGAYVHYVDNYLGCLDSFELTKSGQVYAWKNIAPVSTACDSYIVIDNEKDPCQIFKFRLPDILKESDWSTWQSPQLIGPATLDDWWPIVEGNTAGSRCELKDNYLIRYKVEPMTTTWVMPHILDRRNNLQEMHPPNKNGDQDLVP